MSAIVVIIGPKTILHESSSSQAIDRFALPRREDLVIPDGKAAEFRYNNNLCRWRFARWVTPS